MNIAILFGGRSAEHEISLMSAKNVFQNLEKSRYYPILIKIDKSGLWLTDLDMIRNLSFSEIQDFASFDPKDDVLLQPGAEYPIIIARDASYKVKIDAIFPVLHGPNGEDGTVQGMLKLLGIPFVGPALLGSAVGMDKEVMKRLLREAGIKIGDYLVARYGAKPDFDEVQSRLGMPVFIKPANMGSSVGISKVRDEQQYDEAIRLAYNFDTKLVIEANIEGREIECAILGNEEPKASIPGEIRATKDFYDYESKYLDDKGYEITIPAKVDKDTERIIRDIAVKTFQVLECEGLSRVDVFLTKENEVIVNEINTIPGFTSISMYPMLWKETGINYQELISKLIDLALSRFEREKKLKMSL
ncbi:MAG: D-alanine--D-alanine ligase [Saprospiraceae bacterium]|nr:D-alanine--D-alanine ligase [Saprospiraceae bacterium]